MSLKKRLWEFLKERKSLVEIYSNFEDEKESTIRGRLNENVGRCFERIGRGIYIATFGEIQAVIINGDSREELKKIEDESIDQIIMDFPYNILDKQMQTGTTRKRNLRKGWLFQTEDLDEEYYSELLRILKPGGHMFSFMPASASDTHEYLENQIKIAKKCGWTYNRQWVWDKKHMGMGYRGRARHELIYFFSKGKRRLFGKGHPMRATPDVLCYPREHYLVRKHETQKPIDLIARLVEFGSEPGEIVLDPFAGSLSLAAACLQTGRHSISIEIDKGMIKKCLTY